MIERIPPDFDQQYDVADACKLIIRAMGFNPNDVIGFEVEVDRVSIRAIDRDLDRIPRASVPFQLRHHIDQTEGNRMSHTNVRSEFDPATNQDNRFPKHGEFDTAFIKGEDIPEVSTFEDVDGLIKENNELRAALRNSRRRTTNQRRELRRLAKLDELHQLRYHAQEQRIRGDRFEHALIRKNLVAELNDLRNTLTNITAKKTGWFRR